MTDLLAHGHGSGFFVCIQLHWLRSGGSFTLETTLLQDRVKYLKLTVLKVKSAFKYSPTETMCFSFGIVTFGYFSVKCKKRALACKTVATVSSRSL